MSPSAVRATDAVAEAVEPKNYGRGMMGGMTHEPEEVGSCHA